MKCQQNCSKSAGLMVSFGYNKPETMERKKAEWPVCDNCATELCKKLDITEQVYTLKSCPK